MCSYYNGFQLRSNFCSATGFRGICVRERKREGLKRNLKVSAEPGRKSAYSTDVRSRVVYQCIGMGITFENNAQNLNNIIATSTVHRNFKLSGDIYCCCRLMELQA